MIKNQIDNVMIASIRKYYIINVKSYRGNCKISNHNLERLKIYFRLSLKWREKKLITQKFSVNKLKKPVNISNYAEKINRNIEVNSNIEFLGKIEKKNK